MFSDGKSPYDNISVGYQHLGKQLEIYTSTISWMPLRSAVYDIKKHMIFMGAI